MTETKPQTAPPAKPPKKTATAEQQWPEEIKKTGDKLASLSRSKLRKLIAYLLTKIGK